jgi:hypothetical protein
MRLTPYLEALEADLADIAAVGDENVAAAAQRLAHALRSSFGLRLLDLLGEAALEVSAQLPSGHVEVRLAGQEPSLVYLEAAAAEEPIAAGDDALSARITLRLPEPLKARVEEAAARERISVNTWVIRSAVRALTRGEGPQRGPGNRLTGYAQS